MTIKQILHQTMREGVDVGIIRQWMTFIEIMIEFIKFKKICSSSAKIGDRYK